MRALQLQDVGDLRLVDVPTREPRDGHVLVRASHCALCRTDAKMWQRGHRDLVLPRVLGHEISGIREDTGERVVVWPGESCGECPQCRRGAENLCPEMRILGFHRDGGFAECVVAPESSLVPVPDALPSDLACLAEPLACALNALEQVGDVDRSSLLVYGAGPVGLLLCLAGTVKGARVRAVDTDPSKLQRSDEFRARLEIGAGTDAGGANFEVAINAAPSNATLLEGVRNLEPGGCFCLFSGLTGEDAVPSSVLNEIHYRQLRVVGAYGCTSGQMADALTILSEHRDCVELLVQDRLALAQVPDAISRVLSGESLRYVVELERH